MTLRSFTLHDQIERNTLLHGNCTAFVADGQAITHAQYAARAASFPPNQRQRADHYPHLS